MRLSRGPDTQRQTTLFVVGAVKRGAPAPGDRRMC